MSLGKVIQGLLESYQNIDFGRFLVILKTLLRNKNTIFLAS